MFLKSTLKIPPPEKISSPSVTVCSAINKVDTEGVKVDTKKRKVYTRE